MNETSAVHNLLIMDARGSRKLPLDGLKYTIGRDVNNNIQLHSRFVSRQHAILLRVPGTESGKYLYRIVDGDLSGKPSVNGVVINSHQRVISYDLRHGDIITLAPNVQLTYLTDDLSTEILIKETLNAIGSKPVVVNPGMNLGINSGVNSTSTPTDYGDSYGSRPYLAIEDATGGFS